MSELLRLFWLFARMSAITFGGGYAMLPLLQREIVERRKWLTQEQLVDYYAISQGLPGIIAINAAIFIGRERKGLAGGIAAALGTVSPCLLIITLIAAVLGNVQDNPLVRRAFSGVALCVAALLMRSVLDLWKKAVLGWRGLLVFSAVLAGMLWLRVSPVFFIAGAAAIGLFAGYLRRRKNAREEA